MLPILNIATYKFVPIADPNQLQDELRTQALAAGLTGTILLAEEGLNLFLAGPEAGARAFVADLKADDRFADLAPKESWSATQPFKKLIVKVKREIIRMNHPTIKPDFSQPCGRAPAADAHTVRRWLDQGHDDEGRPVVTLDTRNAFEVDVGTFKGAIDWRLNKFSDFPQALLEHKAELQDKTVVSFCTGGIRCEKAALFMRQAGLKHVVQLEGGILKYFEETGGAHYQGDCFVFDERIAVKPDLSALQDASPEPGAQRPKKDPRAGRLGAVLQPDA
ncbi:MAG: sulfurtransferase [Betaproteobacteria bacterium]|nr:sulfurtransferase [Betaproteobacteria bacterium]